MLPWLASGFKSKGAPLASLLPLAVIVEVDADAGASLLILELSLIRVLLNPTGAVGFAHWAWGCPFLWWQGMLLRIGGGITLLRMLPAFPISVLKK